VKIIWEITQKTVPPKLLLVPSISKTLLINYFVKMRIKFME